MHRSGLSVLASEIAEVGSSVCAGIAVEDFRPASSAGHTHAIVVARNRSEIADDKNDVAVVCGLADETQHALFRVAAIDPFESGAFAIQFMQCAFVAVGVVQIRDPALGLTMRRKIEQMPVQTVVVGPFPPLPELASHE